MAGRTLPACWRMLRHACGRAGSHCLDLLSHAAVRLRLSGPPCVPDQRTGCAAGADALGPRDAPSLQDAPSLLGAGAAAAPAPAPAADGAPLQPPGNLSTYADLAYPAQPRDLVYGPRGPLEALGPGLCPSYLDQIHNTCPVPDLPQRPFAPGGPVNRDPPPIAPPTLTPAVAQMAAAMGLIVVEMNASSTGAAAGAPAQAAPQVAGLAQLSPGNQAAMAALTVPAANSLNAGDAWVVRNQNCGIAPIHAILNKARPLARADDACSM